MRDPGHLASQQAEHFQGRRVMVLLDSRVTNRASTCTRVRNCCAVPELPLLF